MKVVTLLTLFSFFTLAVAQEHHKRHSIDLFLGAALETKTNNKDETGMAYGLEYTYHINKDFGLGVALETLRNETLRELIVVVPVTYHINAQWSIFAGPGYEKGDHEGQYLLRVGLGYTYALGDGFVLEPKVMLDAIESGRMTWVGGVSLGYGF